MAVKNMRICDAHRADGDDTVPGVARNITVDGKRHRKDLCDPCYKEHVQPTLDWLDSLDKPVKKSAAKPKRRKGPEPAKVRAWAQEQGHDVSERGRIPQDLTDQYNAAH